MAKKKLERIWVDADACPKAIKEVIYRAAIRLNVPLKLVANSYLTIPHHELIQLMIVEKGQDVADKYIIEHTKESDLIITADIPLAAKVVELGALALNPRGEIYDEENIGEILSMRNFMQELRDGGSMTSGPAALSAKDVERFANSLNKIFS